MFWHTMCWKAGPMGTRSNVRRLWVKTCLKYSMPQLNHSLGPASSITAFNSRKNIRLGSVSTSNFMIHSVLASRAPMLWQCPMEKVFPRGNFTMRRPGGGLEITGASSPTKKRICSTSLVVAPRIASSHTFSISGRSQ